MRAALACALALAVGLMAAAQGRGAYGAFANAPYSKASDFVDILDRFGTPPEVTWLTLRKYIQ